MMPFQFVPQEPSEEEKQEMIRAHMRRVDFHNGFLEWLSQMNAHQLWMLRVIFGTIARSGEPMGAALMHEGMMIGHLQTKGVCPTCNVDHLRAEVEASAPYPNADPMSPIGPDVPGALPEDVHAGMEEKYAQYHVTPLSDNPGDPRVRCLGRGRRDCHMQWPTFADRESNAGPDDCPGCAIREAHG